MRSLVLKKTNIQIVNVSSCRSSIYLINTPNNAMFLNQNYLTSVSSPSTIVKAINEMVINEIGHKLKGVMAFVSNENDVKNKIFTINNAKLVKKNGKRMVKIEVSTEKLKAVGKYAKEAIKLKNNFFKDVWLTVTSLSFENLLSPGVAITTQPRIENNYFNQSYLFASEDEKTNGYFVRIETSQRVVITQGEKSFSMASWDEENLTLRIWLRNNNPNNWSLNIAVFPRFLINAYFLNKVPLRLRVSDGQLTLENGSRADWITLSNISVSNSTGPCISSRNCISLPYA